MLKAELLSNKFKSEQQKATERQNLEMMKRRQSVAPFSQMSASIERRRQTNECSKANVDIHSSPVDQSLNVG